MSEIENVISGGFNLLDWYRSGRAAVIPELSTGRAARCIACTLNGEGPLTQWFTEPLSERMKKEIEKRAEYHLLTPYDAALGVCQACSCPLKTKVHEPIDLVLKHLSAKNHDKLWEKCWILHEEQQTNESETTHERTTTAKGKANRRRFGLLSWYRRKRGLPDRPQA
jgi:hypothetical protein